MRATIAIAVLVTIALGASAGSIGPQRVSEAASSARRVKLPDLVVRSVLTEERPVEPGAALATDYVAANDGGRKAGKSAAGFYLSADRRRSAGDIALRGRHSTPSLKPRQRRRLRAGPLVSRRTRNGRFHVIACVDDRKRIRESDENVNCRASRRRVIVYRTPPVIALSRPADGAEYVRGATVAASYRCADEAGGSGLAQCQGSVANDSSIVTETLGRHSFTVVAADRGGNRATTTVSYTVVDKTAPTIGLTSPSDGAEYARGTAVNASYRCNDEPGGSGLVECRGTAANDSPIATATLGSHSFTVVAADGGGNRGSKTVSYAVVDKTPPSIDLANPADGAEYARGAEPRAAYACTDEEGGSGIVECEGTVANGQPIDTATLGQRSFAVRARDRGGNEAVKTVGYTVVRAPVGTAQDFDDDGGTPFEPNQTDKPPPPEFMAGGPTGAGRFLRLSAAVPGEMTPISNTIAFSVTDPRPHPKMVADFDLRMAPGATVAGAGGRADGIGFALLDAAQHGTVGAVVPHLPPFRVEEPNFKGSVGVGFDIYKNPPASVPPGEDDDIGNENVAANFTNTVSVHFDGKVVRQQDVSAVADLARGSWIHARVIVEGGTAFSPGTVSVILMACGDAAVTVVDRLPVPGLRPYEARAWFGARSGGESADSDIDNVDVQFLDAVHSLVSLSAVQYEAAETATSATLTLSRTGRLETSMTVQASTSDAGATADSDYDVQSATVTFGPNEATKTLTVPLRDDALDEGDEGFIVQLANASGAAVVGGPSRALVTVKDDERASERGQWSAPQCLPVVPIHSSVLPTGDVLVWDRFGAARLWTPGTGAVKDPAQPTDNVFCSGHAFTADGRLLVSGGHHRDGSPAFDGDGIKTASCYDPVTGQWSPAPDMNTGRWYPTNTTLANGDVLVVSGSHGLPPTKNTLPQIWQPGGGTCGSWRDLSAADQLEPLGVELYPWMFLAPDGRVFKAGPDAETWWLSTTGTGAWTPGPRSSFGLRTYGSAVLYDEGKALIVGGSRAGPSGPEAPTTTTEVIDLAQGSGWEPAGSMNFGRRHLSATVLADGAVLATGGTSGAGFNNEKTPVLAAERWNPVTRMWTTMASMKVPRTYHSTALLLPDARVLVAGGGQGAAATQHHSEIEIYSPPYLFRGPRPAISSAPPTATYGQPLLVETSQAESITRVTLVRLPSVTHSFDQNSRFMNLTFQSRPEGIVVTAPGNPNTAPPGHYMLFIINSAGVPSTAKTVKLGAA